MTRRNGHGEVVAAAKCWDAASAPGRVLAGVEKRLVAGGAVTELRQFYGLSAQEIDVLLWLERDDTAAPSGPHAARAEVAA